MTWSSKRKIQYITGVTSIILLIIAAFVYFKFIKHTPDCFDKIQNQNERGVDCGGVCSLMCISDTKPLIPLWTRPVKITGDVYSVVSYIENQNTGNGVKSVPYEIRLFDERNILVSEPIKGETFIGPNDRTAIYASYVKSGNRIPKTAFLKFLSQPQYTKIDPRFDTQNIVIERDELTDLDTAPKMTATVKNATLDTYVKIPVVVIIYDANKNVIGSSQTFIEKLGPEESRDIFFSWPEPFPGIPARREIIPRINPFIQPSQY